MSIDVIIVQPLEKHRISLLPTKNRSATVDIVTEETTVLDYIIDIVSSLLPGITFSITYISWIKDNEVQKLNKLLSSVIPVSTVFLWYLFKFYFLNRRHKVGTIASYIIGYFISVLIILITWSYF